MIAPDRVRPRGGYGPLQPEWDDVLTYSAEWHRRFRDWHRQQFPDLDDVATRDNLDQAVADAERREALRAR